MRNRPQRNNNPVNLRYAKQTEAIGNDDDRFAIFPTPESGWRAAHAQIRLDQARKLTIKAFIFKFAPPNENDTNHYLEMVCNALGKSPSDMLSDCSVFALAGIMAQIEGYYQG